MRGRRRLTAAVAAGMVTMMMSGCGATAPTGDALYREGEKRYVDYATVMHDVIMAIHEGEWTVESYGASPIACRASGGGAGYAFSWVRTLEPEQLDEQAVVADASGAFERAGLRAQTAERGTGEGREVTVVATGEPVGRGVVTIRPARGTVEVSANAGCFPGDAAELSDLLFDGLVYPGAARRFPAFEGPSWRPRFYFPEEGSPIYRNEDGTPVQPQPDVTEFPAAPYSG